MRWVERRTKVLLVLLILGRRAKRNQWTAPPLNIVVPGKYDDRCGSSQVADEASGCQILAVACAQTEVSAQYYSLRLEIGYQVLHRLEKRWLGDTAKVQIGDVDDTTHWVCLFT